MSETLTIKEKNDKLKTFIFQKFQDGELDNDTFHWCELPNEPK